MTNWQHESTNIEDNNNMVHQFSVSRIYHDWFNPPGTVQYFSSTWILQHMDCSSFPDIRLLDKQEILWKKLGLAVCVIKGWISIPNWAVQLLAMVLVTDQKLMQVLQVVFCRVVAYIFQKPGQKSPGMPILVYLEQYLEKSYWKAGDIEGALLFWHCF